MDDPELSRTLNQVRLRREDRRKGLIEIRRNLGSSLMDTERRHVVAASGGKGNWPTFHLHTALESSTGAE
jgi:hypothetical protein